MVPEGWKVKQLADICSKQISYGIVQTGEHQPNGIPCLRVVDLTKDEMHPEEMIRTSVEIHESYRKTILEKDEIVMALRGEVGLVRQIDTKLVGANITRGLARISAKPHIVAPEFLLWELRSPKFRADLMRRVGGSALQEISLSELRKVQTLIPPLPEQKKIAQILSTWDKAITTTEQLLANSQQQKKALMQQLLTGKKRLLDKNGVRFRGGWRFLTFDEAFKVANKKSAQVKSSDYFATGSVPVVDQGKELIAGYCDNDERYTNVPVIIFGDHTRCLKWVDFEFCPGADGTQVLDSKEFLDKKFGYYLLCHTDIPNLGYSRHMRELKEKDFKVPVDMVEQQKIAAVLSTADQEITALQQKLDALKQEKKALMQQLLTGKRRVVIE